MRRVIFGLLVLCLFIQCKKVAISQPDQLPVTPTPVNASNVSYLALGDSYTIGHSVSQDESFPYQLKTRLASVGVTVTDLSMIAQTGWTTDELITSIARKDIKTKFDFVTLLIGVNNQYRGYNKDVYKNEFRELLNTAITYANGDVNRVFVLSIPDWGVTPFAGEGIDPEISKDIDVFNDINMEESAKLKVNYLNITQISRMALEDPSLICGDHLHPSASMYKLWVDALLPMVRSKI